MNEPLNILLHAAARGARIESQISGAWSNVYGLKLGTEPNYPVRIDPDDQHLRYGPISRQLFEAAKKPTPDAMVFDLTHGNFWINTTDYKGFVDCARTETRRMFLLMLAEELCHEGL